MLLTWAGSKGLEGKHQNPDPQPQPCLGVLRQGPRGDPPTQQEGILGGGLSSVSGTARGSLVGPGAAFLLLTPEGGMRADTAGCGGWLGTMN